MRAAVFILILSSISLFSCKQNKSSQHGNIIGMWHAIKLENPDMDSFFANSQVYIDTIGKSNDDMVNLAIYGVTNMDSMRKILQQQYDSAKAMQENAVLNTVFNFRKDSVVILSFNGATDSSRWYFDKGDTLVLDELNKGNAGDRLKMQVITLSPTTLKLRFMENDAYSTVTFEPDHSSQ